MWTSERGEGVRIGYPDGVNNDTQQIPTFNYYLKNENLVISFAPDLFTVGLSAINWKYMYTSVDFFPEDNHTGILLGQPAEVIVDLAKLPDEAKVGGRVYLEPVLDYKASF